MPGLSYDSTEKRSITGEASTRFEAGFSSALFYMNGMKLMLVPVAFWAEVPLRING